MIVFNTLRITTDNSNLVLDVSTSSQSYFTNMYITKIVVDNQDTYVEGGPSTNPIYTKTISGTTTRSLQLTLTVADLAAADLANDMLFVYVIEGGTPTADTPCGMDGTTNTGVVMSMCNFYNRALTYIREVEDDCNIKENFINFILRFNALLYAIKTQHYTLAIKYFKKFFYGITSDNIVTTNCGCNG